MGTEIIGQLLMSVLIIQVVSMSAIIFILGVINSKIESIFKRLNQKENSHHIWEHSWNPLERNENEL